jgi:hypothetical protein
MGLYAVVMISPVGTMGTPRIRLGTEHEMVNHELMAIFE